LASSFSSARNVPHNAQDKIDPEDAQMSLAAQVYHDPLGPALHNDVKEQER